MFHTTGAATTFAPGTNVRWDVGGANWIFLLPSLELEQVVLMGRVSPRALATLAARSRRVTVIGPGAGELREIASRRRQAELANVQVVDGRGAWPAAPAEGRADLVAVLGASTARRLGTPSPGLGRLERLLKPGGLLYFETRRRAAGRLRSAEERLARQVGGGRAQLFWLTPLAGEMRTAVPLGDRETIDYFIRRELYSPFLRLPARFRALKRAARLLERRLVASPLGSRAGILTARAPAPTLDQVPRYLQTIARTSGLDLSRHRWGLSARGDYGSRKVLVFLFEEGSTGPDIIVKMVRDPALNSRLENEHWALAWLHERRIGDRETLPWSRFFGHHGDLAVLGETAIEGEPFRQRTEWTARCRHARAAIDGLATLGLATVNRSGSPPAIAGCLARLLGRYAEIYGIESRERGFLEEQIHRIGAREAPFPLVFLHGDPGTWNALVTPSGRVAMLDWEWAEREGMPLWDLFYFMRSFSVGASRGRGERRSLEAVRHTLLADTDVSRLLVETADRYVRGVGLAPDLVEPLFYTCWMHRALKEATRLDPARLDRGHYVQLLRLCMKERDAPALRRLFSLGGARQCKVLARGPGRSRPRSRPSRRPGVKTVQARCSTRK